MTEAIDDVVERAFPKFSLLKDIERKASVCIARGYTTNDAVETLNVSESSFSEIKTGMKRKLGLNSDYELLATVVVYWRIRGLDFEFRGNVEKLTPHQLEIVMFKGIGLTNSEIVDYESIDDRSVRTAVDAVINNMYFASSEQFQAFAAWYVLKNQTAEYTLHLRELAGITS